MTNVAHIVCPHCDAVNRVPAEKDARAANCGKCHEQLFGGHPVALNANSFAKYLANNTAPLLVDFWAPWCGPCRTMAPIFEQAAKSLEPRVRLIKINTEEEQQLASRYGIRSIPTLALFKQGTEIARIAGAMDLANLLRWTEQYL